MNVKSIHIDDYFYTLPPNRIARYPLEERDACKLLLYNGGEIQEDSFKNLASHLPQGAFLVFNNTKVIPARLRFQKETGAKIEIFCLKPLSPSEYETAFEVQHTCQWDCAVGNNSRWKEGILQCSIPYKDKGDILTITAKKIERKEGSFVVEFTWNLPLSFAQMIDAMGEIPIPPYLERPSEPSDKENYQTIYSKIKGSVASPTAGLHFTERTFQSLQKQSISWGELTLHVGAGTFLPVKSETIGEHIMHCEIFTVKYDFLQSLKENLGNIIAVGTTSVRTLESLYQIGCMLHTHPDTIPHIFEIKQWSPYENKESISRKDMPSTQEALDAILFWMQKNHLNELHGNTGIIIAPGYQFRVVDGMITNFHQPKSTLLLLISAFVGEKWRDIYRYALLHNFRFLSYGDASLLLR